MLPPAQHADVVARLEPLYPCDQPEPEVELPGPGDVVVPLRIRHGDGELSFFGLVAAFGTPLVITVSELAIESFCPADQATARVLRGAADGGVADLSPSPPPLQGRGGGGEVFGRSFEGESSLMRPVRRGPILVQLTSNARLHRGL